MHYNTAFPGHQIAMPPPLAKDNFVKYQDGIGLARSRTRTTSPRSSPGPPIPRSTSASSIGWLVMLYLAVTTVLLYLGKKRIWSTIPH